MNPTAPRRTPKDAITLEIHPPAAGFHRYLFRHTAFPIKSYLLHRWIDLYATLRPLLFPHPAKTVTAIEMAHLHHNDGASILSTNAPAWQPDFGVGVWLQDPPPTLWSPEEFEELGPGDTLRPPINTAIALTAERLDHAAAWAQLAGRGAYLEFSIDGQIPAFLEAQATLYRTWIKEVIIAAHSTFLPLLSLNAFDSDLFTQRLPHLEQIQTYVRESPQDEGLLILSRTNLDKLIGDS